jgi:hypothetical protein
MLKLKIRIKGLFSLEKTKTSQRKKNLVFIVFIFREKNAHMLIHIMVKLKVFTGFCSTFVLLVGEKIMKNLFIQNVLKIVRFKVPRKHQMVL